MRMDGRMVFVPRETRSINTRVNVMSRDRKSNHKEILSTCTKVTTLDGDF